MVLSLGTGYLGGADAPGSARPRMSKHPNTEINKRKRVITDGTTGQQPGLKRLKEKHLFIVPATLL